MGENLCCVYGCIYYDTLSRCENLRSFNWEYSTSSCWVRLIWMVLINYTTTTRQCYALKELDHPTLSSLLSITQPSFLHCICIISYPTSPVHVRLIYPYPTKPLGTTGKDAASRLLGVTAASLIMVRYDHPYRRQYYWGLTIMLCQLMIIRSYATLSCHHVDDTSETEGKEGVLICCFSYSYDHWPRVHCETGARGNLYWLIYLWRERERGSSLFAVKGHQTFELVRLERHAKMLYLITFKASSVYLLDI